MQNIKKIRVQKFLASIGLGSRRAIEHWIVSQRLKINNITAQLGATVDGTEHFTLDDQTLKSIRFAANKSLIDDKLPSGMIKPNIAYQESNTIDHPSNNSVTDSSLILIYNKPPGKICSRIDPQRRPTVFADLPDLAIGRWISVGRLDFNTSGLLLFTNNGDVAHSLMHPSFNQEREYIVRVFGKANNKNLFLLTKGIKIKGKLAKFEKITLMKQNNSNSWYKVILTEGRNREIKNLFASQNLIVNRLMRIRYGNILLPQDLKIGRFKYLRDHNFA
jgi:23S rRNA pseudouridine2605 synthase